MDKASTSIRIRLSAMMFLQYMMFAVWWVQLAGYLGKIEISATWQFWILAVMPLGCLVAPLICMVADRHFASQKVLIVLNFACAVLFFIGARQTNPASIFVFLLLAMLCYMPTWSLTNTIAMSNFPSDKFPQIRVFGSIGWVASAVFGLIASMSLFGEKVIDGTAIPLYCGAGIALLAGIVNLTLPNTPPPSKGKEASIVDALGLRAMTLLKDRNFALFIIISMLVMIPFTLYFSLGSQFFISQGFKQVTAIMNLGQFVEIFLMLLVPLALSRFGVKKTMLMGVGALAIRYITLWCGVATGQTFLYYIAILVHGIIFGFFFVGGQVYVDKKAPLEIRAQAQGLIVLACYGVGMLIGTFINVELIERYTTDGVCNWNPVFVINAIVSAVLLVALCVFFRNDIKQAAAEPVSTDQEPQS
jgi:nucleoside transporter